MRARGTRLHVDDFAGMFRFYRDTMGLPVFWGNESSGYASFGTDAPDIAIFGRRDMAEAIGAAFTAAGPGPQDRAMLTFEVDDVDATFRRLRDQGIEIVSEPKDQPGWEIRTAHLRDPEGNLIEINHPLSE
ncbi:MAG: VOC family protein [Anaerolineae bacterium]